MPSRTRALLTVCVIVVVLVGACRDDDGGDASALDTSTTGAPRSSSTTTATATTAVAEKDLTATSRVRLDGIGPIVMGMTLAEATGAVGRRVAVIPESLINDDGTDRCGFARVEGGPDMKFMVNRDGPADEWTIVRLDVGGESTVATGAGIKVGSSEDDVKRAYEERVRTEPHNYTADEGGHYMILDVDGPGGMRLLFETDGTKVLTYRSGFEGAVDAPEGCL